MKFSNNRGSALTLETVIVLITVLVVVSVYYAWSAEVKNNAEGLDYLECKYTLEAAKAATVQRDVLWAELGLQPLSEVCTPKEIPAEAFKDAKGDPERVANIILNKMRHAWSASGEGKYNNIWSDYDKLSQAFFGGDDAGTCKVLYYFELQNILGNQQISENVFSDYKDRMPLPDINAPLGTYIKQSAGQSNKIYVAFGDSGVLQDDKIYLIIVSSDQKNNNDLLITEQLGTDRATIDMINDKVGSDLCGRIETFS